MKKTFLLSMFALCGLFAVDANAGVMTIKCSNGNTAVINVRDRGNMDENTYNAYLQGIADQYCNCTNGGCSASWTVKYTISGGGSLIVDP